MTIQTDRLLLRHWREDDAEALFRWARDPEVGPIAGWPAHRSVAESREIIRTVLSAPEAYAICRKEDREPIGTAELKLAGRSDIAQGNDECELGFWLARPYWGAGLMTEAAKALIERAFTDLGMSKVWCAYYAGNDRSRRVQEKCGFRYQWTSCDLDVPLLGERRTGIVNCLTKVEWEADRARA